MSEVARRFRLERHHGTAGRVLLRLQILEYAAEIMTVRSCMDPPRLRDFFDDLVIAHR